MIESACCGKDIVVLARVAARVGEDDGADGQQAAGEANLFEAASEPGIAADGEASLCEAGAVLLIEGDVASGAI